MNNKIAEVNDRILIPGTDCFVRSTACATTIIDEVIDGIAYGWRLHCKLEDLQPTSEIWHPMKVFFQTPDVPQFLNNIKKDETIQT